MAEESHKTKEKLELNDLDGVSGGTVISYPRSIKRKRENIICPKCRSGNILGFYKTDFDSEDEAQEYVDNSILVCGNCGFTNSAKRFKAVRA